MRIRVITPQQRWRAAEARADAAREAGIQDRTDEDARQLCSLDLRGAGGPWVTLEPCRDRLAWRARDAVTGEVLESAALKTLVRALVGRLPRAQAPRSAPR